jgi:hypothetical protein
MSRITSHSHSRNQLPYPQYSARNLPCPLWDAAWYCNPSLGTGSAKRVCEGLHAKYTAEYTEFHFNFKQDFVSHQHICSLRRRQLACNEIIACTCWLFSVLATDFKGSLDTKVHNKAQHTNNCILDHGRGKVGVKCITELLNRYLVSNKTVRLHHSYRWFLEAVFRGYSSFYRSGMSNYSYSEVGWCYSAANAGKNHRNTNSVLQKVLHSYQLFTRNGRAWRYAYIHVHNTQWNLLTTEMQGPEFFPL